MEKERLHRLLLEKRKPILRYLLRVGASVSDAEEIVQDTLYKGFLYLDAIDPEKFTSWLFKVALHQYYDLCRKKKRRVEIPLDAVLLIDPESPDRVVIDEEQRREVQQTLEELPAVYKQMLLMKYDLGLSYQEIGELLDCKPEMVKTYLYRARKQFEKRYGGRES